MSKHDGYCAMGLDGRYTNLQCECDFIGLVREDQNERIIKLLEADLCTNSEWGWTNCYGLNKEHCERLNEYIELIKGETNGME